jgi:hypothetical protein
MASAAPKRSAPKSGGGSKKRQKITPTNDFSSAPKKAVAVDALPWNEVKLPDMYDDAEGFFGLEEVEGVEVVKEGGNIKFVRSNNSSVADKLNVIRFLQAHQLPLTTTNSKVSLMMRLMLVTHLRNSTSLRQLNPRNHRTTRRQ